MSKTKIQWTNETWNPVTGCTKISEGCQNCYAEKMANRLKAMGQVKYRNGFKPTIHDYNMAPLNISGNNKMIFVCSMGDLFHSDVPTADIERILFYIKNTPEHTFQILTKRADRLLDFEFPNNVWLGVSVELAKYKHRIDDLRQTDAKVKFLSCEPLLGDLGKLDLSGIDWVIVGGESGSGARPMHPDWVRNILRQCHDQGVPFFFKQWGGWQPVSSFYEDDYGYYNDDLFNESCFSSNSIIIEPLGYYRYFDEKKNRYIDNCQPAGGSWIMAKVGKKKAGRLLDGQVWDQMPEVL